MWCCSPHPQQVQETISVLDSKTSSTWIVSLITGNSIAQPQKIATLFLKKIKKLFLFFLLTSNVWAQARRPLDVKDFFNFLWKKTPRFRGVFYCYEVDIAHTGPQIFELLPHHQQYNGRELMQDSQGYLTPPTQNCQGYFISALSDVWSFVLY